MAGTANNFRLDGRVLGAGIIWAGLPVPSASSRLTLATVDADGFITPDATANPSAYPLGATKDGVVLSSKTSRDKKFVDEIQAPVDSIKQQTEMSIKAELHAMNDSVLMTLLAAGFGTYSTAAGYKQITIGTVADVFTGIAFIAPQRADPTKVLIFHIYKAINESGFEFGVNNKDLGSSAALFEGYAITTRTPSDILGNYWWQIT